MIFIMRYYSDVDYEDYDLGSKLKESLVKEEKKRVWMILDHVLIKLDTFLEEFKNRNILTAKALAEIFSYIEGLKKSVNESRMRKSMEVEGQNRSALEYKSMDDMQGPSRFAEKQDLETLRKEIDALKSSIKPGKESNSILKAVEGRTIEDRLTDVPKAYLVDGLTNELASLKGKMSKMQMTIESLEKTTDKLTDDRQTKMTNLEKKVSDDLESFKLFKERV